MGKSERKMSGFDRVENVVSLSQAQINKLNNTQLKQALTTMVGDYGNDEPTNATLLQEIQGVKEDIKEIREMKVKITALSSKLDQAFAIIHQQQKFLELLDSRHRQRNIIITGVSEEEDSLGKDDRSKIISILEGAGYDDHVNVSEWGVRRLGKGDGRKRPILLEVEDNTRRDAILRRAKNLKGKGEPLGAVYIKKDIHPAVRKELQRMRKREKEEKEKPGNQGTNIYYDSAQRVLLRDGEIIDRYSPSFF